MFVIYDHNSTKEWQEMEPQGANILVVLNLSSY